MAKFKTKPLVLIAFLLADIISLSFGVNATSEYWPLLIPVLSIKYLIILIGDERIFSNPAFLLIIAYISFSLSYYAFFYETLADTTVHGYTQESLTLTTLLGHIATLATLFVYKIAPQNQSKNKFITATPSILTNNFFLIALFSFFFSLTYISQSLGLSKMGEEAAISLPLGLGGALNVLRIMVIPLIVILIFSETRGRFFLWIITYLTWLMYESYIRSSRGAVINGLLPLFVYYIYSHGFSRKIFIYGGLTTIIGILLYPIITYMRFGGSLETSLDPSALASIDLKIDSFSPFKRLFIGGHISNLFIGIHSEKFYFGEDFYKIFTTYGSPSKYVTFHVDGFSLNVNHSSGMAYFAEGLLLLGVFGFIIYLLAIIFASRSLDSCELSPPQKTMIFLLIYNILQQGFVEFLFYQPQYFLGWALSFFIVSCVNKKHHLRNTYYAKPTPHT